MNSPEGFSVQSVANDLEKCLTLQDKLTVLSKACHGLDAVILTAGPSLSRYTPKQLVDICRNKIVICVKQSIDICPVPCHFHLLNHINYKAYRYTDHRPIVLFESREGEDPGIENGVWDLHFKVDLRATQEGVWLANTRNFDDFLFSQSLIRPWGPGILYEIGFYLVVHLALRSVHVIGWDMSMDSRGTTNHFYDSFATKMKKRLKINLCKKTYYKILKKIVLDFIQAFSSLNFKLGDIVTTSLQTANGETILLTHDTNSPRP